MNINLTLFGQAISFAIFVWFCMKYVWPPIIKAMQERQAKIAEGLAAAERGAEAQEQAERDADKLLVDAKSQAAEIIAQAQKQRNEMITAAKDEARAEGEKEIAKARVEFEQEVVRAKEDLRKQVGQIAVAGAAKILSKEIDAEAHDQVLSDLVAQI